MLSYGISTTLLQILISIGFPIHLSKTVHWRSRKKQFEFSKVSIHCCYKNNNCSGNFCKLPVQTSRVEPFLSTLTGLPGTFPKFYLGQLFCRETFSACFFVKRSSTVEVISVIFQHFKNIQGKAGSCNLKACN